LRTWLVASDAAAAASLLAAVTLVPPSETSRAFALITIVASVLPGLLLTGEVKRLVAGVNAGSAHLLRRVGTAAALNVPAAAAGLLLLDRPLSWPLLAGFVVLAAVGSTAQACSSLWYYTQTTGSRILISKAASAAVRIGFASAAVMRREFTWALVGVPLAALTEFALNQRSLQRVVADAAIADSASVSPLGAAYGLSRAVFAAIKLGLEQLLGSLIASMLVIEQLVGGINSMFEKYFARSMRWRSAIRAGKAIFVAALLIALPWLSKADFSPQNRHAPLMLVVIAVAGLLPLSEMFTALQRRSERFVALGSAIIAAACAAVLALAWWAGWPTGRVSLALYVVMPCLTFVFYWIASTHARHDTQR
jgi:hypothetical protein